MNWFKKCISKKDTIIYEIFPFLVLLVLFWDLALLSPTTDKSNLAWVVVCSIIINALFVSSIVTCILHKVHLFKVNKALKNPCLLIIFAVFIVCFITVLSSWLNLDGYIYYKFIRDLREWNFSWSHLMLAGHMSQGYTVFLMIGEFLFPNQSLGVRFVHCFMALITIYCFYLIVDGIVKKKDNLQIGLFTALFAFSPMLLGMIGDLNTDFPSLCFFVWMVCCGLRSNYIGQAICGGLLCYSKETGVLLYGFYIIGKAIYILFSHRKKGLRKCIRNVFNSEMILLALGGVFWISNYIFNMQHGWGWINQTSVSGASTDSTGIHYKLNSIAVYPSYILEKFRQLIYINFSWLLYGAILIAVMILIWKGSNILRKYVNLNGKTFMGVLFSFFAFVFYNFFYITYDSYRYLLPFAFFLSLGVIAALLVIFQHDQIRKIVTGSLLCLILVSNFYTIDPVSKAMFMTQGTGTGDILVPGTIYIDKQNNAMIGGKTRYGNVCINNGALYNFQCHYFSSCFNKTLRKIDYNDNTLIILPCEYRGAWGTDASVFGVNVAGYSEYYWDTKTHRLNIDCVDEVGMMQKDDRYRRFHHKNVRSLDEITEDTLRAFKKIYYIALPFQPDFDHKKFLAGRPAELTETIQYFGWKWDVYEIMQ